MRIKRSFLLDFSRRFTALALALVMLFNLSSEAAAQYKSFNNGVVPQIDIALKQDATKVVSNDLGVKLQAAKLNASLNALPVISEEEAYKAIKADDPNNTLTEEDIKELYAEYVADAEKTYREINSVFALHKKDYNIKNTVSYIYNKADHEAGTYCDGKNCYDLNNYLRGLLRVVMYQATGSNSNEVKFKWNSEIMLEYMPTIYDLVTSAGVYEKDVTTLQNYLRFVLAEAKDYCDNDTYLVDIMPGLGSSFNGKSNGRKSDAEKGKAIRQGQCAAIGKAMIALGMVGPWYKDKVENANIIHKIMKDTYKDDYGAITLSSGVAALIATHTPYAYTLIEQFLLKDTLPTGNAGGVFKESLKELLGLLSLQSWTEKGISFTRGGGGKFLNENALRFQYIDEDAARELGISDFSVQSFKVNPSAGYNVPFRNVFEDVAGMLAASKTKEGAALANRIVEKFNSSLIYMTSCRASLKINNAAAYFLASSAVCDASVKMHLPLVIGVLESGAIKTESATKAARAINNLDWWDLNEATQRRVNNSVAGKGFDGTVKKTFSAARKNTEDVTSRIRTMSMWGDMVISAIFITMLIASVPSIVRGASNFVNNIARVRSINAAGKANLLKITRARIKAGGVKPAAVKASIAAKRVEAAEIERANALLKQKGLLKTETTAKVAPAEAPVAKYEGTLKVTLTDKTGKATEMVSNSRGTLTATVGEGGGGAAPAAKELTEFEKSAIVRRARWESARADAKATHEAKELMRETELRASMTEKFKGNILFNKPYNQLSSWRKWIFNNYYFRLNPAFNLSKDIGVGLARNPGKTAMFGSLPLGTTVEAARAPIGIYAPVTANTSTSFNIVKLTKDVSNISNIGGQGVASIAKAATPISLPGSTAKILFSMPPLVAVLNEPHSGGSASMRLPSGESASLYAPAIVEAAAAAESKTVTKFKSYDATAMRDESAGKQEFKAAVDLKMSKRKMSKGNKERHEALREISGFITPRLAGELLDIIDINPNGYKTFDNFYDVLTTKIERLKPGQFLTLKSYLPSVNKSGPLDADDIVPLIKVVNGMDETLEDIVGFVSESGNFMVESILKQASVLPLAKQNEFINNILNVESQKSLPNAPKSGYIIALNGNKYEWENLSGLTEIKVALGKEIKEDILKTVEKFVASGRKSGRVERLSYNEFKRYYPEWLVSELNATRKTPAIWFENAEGTYFIYSQDGNTRMRIGGHETLLSNRVNYHFHIEYRNTVDGSWSGPVNYNFRWPDQDLLPSDVINEIFLAPVRNMERRGVLINRADLDPSVFAKITAPAVPAIERQTFAGLPEGWSLTNENVYVAAPQQFIAETRAPENFLPAAPVMEHSFADPLTVASFFFIPFFTKFTSKGDKKALVAPKETTDQSLFRPLAKGETPASSEDLLSMRPDLPNMRIAVAEEGFKLSFISEQDGPEKELPVKVSIDNRFKIKGYDRIVFNGEVAELRDGDKKPTPMSDFFMMFMDSKTAFAQFVSLIRNNAQNLEGDFKLKLVSSKGGIARKTTVTNLHFASNDKRLPIEVTMPANMLPEGHILVIDYDGTLGTKDIRTGKVEKLNSTHIRIPKNQIKNLVVALKDSPRKFGLYIGQGTNKADIVVKDVSMTNVSLGKTFAPVVKHSLDMTEADATSLMFIINYFLPGLSIFLNPVLKRVGENKLLLTSLALSTFAGIVAISGGFWGFVDSSAALPWKTPAFITAITAMAVASVLKQLVSNMLIRANRGDVSTKAVASKYTAPTADVKGAAGTTAEGDKKAEEVNFNDLMARTKDVFTKKSEVSIKDVFLYNKSFMFKNFGTLLFLASPYLINEVFRIASGIDLGLDYSASFPLYTVYSGMTTWKAYKARLRDAYNKDSGTKKADAKADGKTEEAVKLTPEEEAKAAAEKAAIEKDHNVWNVFVSKPGVIAVSTAMVLATVHEFVLSSSFSSILNQAFNGSSAANFLVALCLYVPLVLGRLLGNIAGQRMSGPSLYIICSALSAVGTAIVTGWVTSPAMVMVGASIASLGVGNFFTQMYNYLAEKHKDYNREISIILALTMSVAAAVALPAKYMVDYFEIANLGLWYSLACLVGSLVLTGQMMQGSTIAKYMKNMFKPSKKSNSGGDNAGQAGAPDAPEGIGPDMNNPLPN